MPYKLSRGCHLNLITSFLPYLSEATARRPANFAVKTVSVYLTQIKLVQTLYELSRRWKRTGGSTFLTWFLWLEVHFALLFGLLLCWPYLILWDKHSWYGWSIIMMVSSALVSYASLTVLLIAAVLVDNRLIPEPSLMLIMTSKFKIL